MAKRKPKKSRAKSSLVKKPAKKPIKRLDKRPAKKLAKKVIKKPVKKLVKKPLSFIEQLRRDNPKLLRQLEREYKAKQKLKLKKKKEKAISRPSPVTPFLLGDTLINVTDNRNNKVTPEKATQFSILLPGTKKPLAGKFPKEVKTLAQKQSYITRLAYLQNQKRDNLRNARVKAGKLKRELSRFKGKKKLLPKAIEIEEKLKKQQAIIEKKSAKEREFLEKKKLIDDKRDGITVSPEVNSEIKKEVAKGLDEISDRDRDDVVKVIDLANNEYRNIQAVVTSDSAGSYRTGGGTVSFYKGKNLSEKFAGEIIKVNKMDIDLKKPMDISISGADLVALPYLKQLILPHIMGFFNKWSTRSTNHYFIRFKTQQMMEGKWLDSGIAEIRQHMTKPQHMVRYVESGLENFHDLYHEYMGRAVIEGYRITGVSIEVVESVGGRLT